MNLKYLCSQFQKGRDLIFDLDNTLISENQFLYSAYLEIAKSISIDSSQEIYQFLFANFNQYGRTKLYQKMSNKFLFNEFTLEKFLFLLRNHRPKKGLKILPWFVDLMKMIKSDFNLYIITNGNKTQQFNKIKSIKFPNNVSLKHVIYANDFNKKPNPESYLELAKIVNLNKPIYIGDSETDYLFALRSEIEFFDVKLLLLNK